MRKAILALLIAVGTAAPSNADTLPKPDYISAASIPLPDGRWDLLNADPVHHRVLIARADSLTIVDLGSRAAKSAGNLSRGHAAVPIVGTDLIGVTSGGDNTVRIIDAASGTQVASIPVGVNPDAALFDPASRHLIVMNAKGGTISIVDPVKASVISTIKVKPALELGTMIGPDILAVNDEDANEIEVVDLKHNRSSKPIALPGCEGPTGIAFDPRDHLLLSACANGQAALVDTRSRRLVKLLPIGKGPDGALFDQSRRRFLIPCGQSGVLSVYSVGAGGKVLAHPDIKTEVSARTAALDTQTGNIYLPAAQLAPAAGGGRPTAVAGTMHLLVLKPVAD